MQSAVLVAQVPVATAEASEVWQSKQPMRACGPLAIWKHASCAGKRASLNRVGKWQLLQSVPNPARV